MSTRFVDKQRGDSRVRDQSHHRSRGGRAGLSELRPPLANQNEYTFIKDNLLAKTYSGNYRLRLFYLILAVLLYDIWWLTDFLLKASVNGEMDYVSVLTAGECFEIVPSALIPPDCTLALYRVRLG